MASPYLSIIIPVYNESVIIETVINDHIKILNDSKNLIPSWEIVCCDDASTDSSLEILKALSHRNPNIRVLRHDTNLGIQATFMQLHHEAQGRYIYHTGGDGQWPAHNILYLLNHLNAANLDYVVGVRRNRHEIYSTWRRILSYTFNILPLIFFRIQAQDANGIKLGKKEIFDLPLKSKSFFAEVERIIEAKKRGFKIGYQTIDFLPRSKGKAGGAKWKYIRGTLWDFLKYLGRIA